MDLVQYLVLQAGRTRVPLESLASLTRRVKVICQNSQSLL